MGEARVIAADAAEEGKVKDRVMAMLDKARDGAGAMCGTAIAQPAGLRRGDGALQGMAWRCLVAHGDDHGGGTCAQIIPHTAAQEIGGIDAMRIGPHQDGGLAGC
ncbi:MAG: hypothetical protein EBY30_14015, partial [Rhodospirillales bacterium]|nr:hypothetical protein [Rhodospirillales bacterium]